MDYRLWIIICVILCILIITKYLTNKTKTFHWECHIEDHCLNDIKDYSSRKFKTIHTMWLDLLTESFNPGKQNFYRRIERGNSYRCERFNCRIEIWSSQEIILEMDERLMIWHYKGTKHITNETLKTMEVSRTKYLRNNLETKKYNEIFCLDVWLTGSICL